MPSERAAKGLPSKVEGIVTATVARDKALFLQDKTGGLFIWNIPNSAYKVGDLVEVEGKTLESYRTILQAFSHHKVGVAPLPQPRNATFPSLIRGENDSAYIKVKAKVQAATIDSTQQDPLLVLELKLDEGWALAQVRHFHPNDPQKFLGADIALEGVAGGIFDGTMQMVSVRFFVESTEQIQIMRPGVEKIESLPLTPLHEVMSFFAERDLSSRVRVRGTLTYYHPGESLILEQDGKALQVRSSEQRQLHIGEIVEATGFPDDADYSPTLRWGQILNVSAGKSITPPTISAFDAKDGLYNCRLVTIEGKVISHLRNNEHEAIILESDGILFGAELDKHLDQLDKPIAHGTIVSVTGVIVVKNSGVWNAPKSFSVRLRTASDISVVHMPSWWTVQHLALLLFGLLGLVLAGCTWIWSLQRKVSEQTGVIRAAAQDAIARAAIESKRSQILEDINAKKPLEEILTLVRSLFEIKFPNYVCKIRLEPAGAEKEQESENKHSLFRIERQILSNDGLVLGAILVESDSPLAPIDEVTDNLDLACNLTALALENRQLYKDLLFRSNYDALTGLPNRYSLEKQLTIAIHYAKEHQRHVGLIYIDLDSFKSVNDQYGHHAGDIYLQTVARRLQRRLRIGDLVARVGGDEFVVILPDLPSIEEAKQAAQRLHSAFDEPFRVDSSLFPGMASFGVSTFPEDGDTMDDLKKKADQEMYSSKRRRHGKHSGQTHGLSNGRQIPANQLQHALEEGRFTLYYQPQYTQDGDIYSVEALIRMLSKSGEIILPAAFLPEAERSGFIVHLGEWVLREACTQLRQWKETVSPDLMMMVNVSGVQLQQNNFLEMVMQIVSESSIPPSSLELEITETVLIEHINQCSERLQQLRAFGVKISLDDFGTGYSSLNRIHQFPVDTIKIDRSFIQALRNSPSSRPIVHAIINLAGAVQAKVIAEGVEHQEEIATMIATGCTHFQGYYFSKPKPAAEIEALLLKK